MVLNYSDFGKCERIQHDQTLKGDFCRRAVKEIKSKRAYASVTGKTEKETKRGS